jgi:F-type H+-transporting ATPase subunit b
MPEFNPLSILIQMINFLVLLILLNIIVYKPIRGMLKKRKEEIDSSSNLTDELKRNIEKYSTEIEENIDSTRKLGLKERIGLRNNGLAAEKELLQDAYSQVEEALGKAKNEIKEKINSARTSLQNEMESFSHELAEKILGRGL